jgi:hypothetical protein
MNGPESAATLARQVAIAYLNRIVYNANPQASQTFQGNNTQASLIEVIREMKLASASVLAMTITAAPVVVSQPGPHFIGVGNGIINSSTKRASDGLVCENSFAETLNIICNQDSYVGGASLGNEGFNLSGYGAEADPFAYDWPQGSSAQITLNAISGLGNNSLGNILQNSGFDTYATTANVPDNWSLTVGTAGTHTFQEVTITYSGASALKLVGDGTTLISLQQTFNSSTGTAGTLAALTQYSFCIFARTGGSTPTGQIQIDIIDGFGNIINDANGVANSFIFNANVLNTNYAQFTGVFRTPLILPAAQNIRIHCPSGQALSNNGVVYLDLGSLGLMSQAYTSGPSAAIHSGSIGFNQNDYGQLTITNGRGSGGTLSSFQVLWDQLFSMRQSDLLLPSNAIPTISDTLIS